MNWSVFAGSLAAILMLAGAARALRLGGSQRLDEATAREEAEHALAGFRPTGAAVSADGQAALIAGDHSVALVRAHGAHHVVRRLAAPRVAVEGGRLIVHAGEVIFGATTLELGEAEAQRWAERLNERS